MTTAGRATGARIVGSPQDLRGWLGAVELPDESIEEVHEDVTRGRVVAGNHTVTAVLPVLGQADRPARFFRVVCTPTTLITGEDEALPAIDKVVTQWCTAQPDPTLPGLLVDLLEAAISSGGERYVALRRALDEVARAVEDDPLEVPLTRLLTMKRQLSQLSALWEGQSYCVIEITRHRSHISRSDDARERLRDLVSDGDRGLKLLVHMETRVHDLLQHQLHCLQESTNRRLNMLAILSAIYLPATLIAGIYGMNFEGIPMIQLRHGYLIVMSIMAAVVLGQLWYFHRRGWFS